MESFNTYIAPQAIRAVSKADTATQSAARKAAENFESMFVAEMMRPIFENEDVNDIFGGGQAEKMYRSLMVDEYGKEIAKAGGIGLADHIEKELLRLQEAEEAKTNAK